MNSVYLCLAVGIVDAIAAIAIFISAQAITHNAGWNNTTQRWSMIRRAAYWGLSISLVAKSTYRFDHMYEMGAQEGFAQIYIDGFLMFFPILRATRVISQDHLMVHTNGVSKMLKNVTRSDSNGEPTT
jgi:hypothetical protein